MKTLVVYYSRSGSTRKVAEELRAHLGADIEEITEPKGRGGPLGWLKSGRESTKGDIVPINPPKADPSAYELVVVGTPTWAGNVSSPVRSYLTETRGKLSSAAFFCCMDGNSGETFNTMERVSGRAPVATIEVMSGEVKSGTYKEKLKAFSGKIAATS